MSNLLKKNTVFLEKHPSFCILPYIHLRMRVHEKAESCNVSSLCCSAAGCANIPSNGSLNDMLQHTEFKQERQAFSNNLIPAACENACSLNYKSITKREIFNDLYINNISYEEVFNKPTIKLIDYNFGNECNLSCRMCSTTFSDQIGLLANKETSSIENTSELIKLGINDLRPDESLPENIKLLSSGNFIRKPSTGDTESLKQVLPNLLELQISGGEPFISSDVEDILCTAIDNNDNQHITLEVTTNGTKFIEEKLDIFLKFKKIHFIVSVDGIGSTYDYIRHPFSYNILEKRLKDIVRYIIDNNLQEKVSFGFASVGILYNIYSYAELHKSLNIIFKELYDSSMLTLITGVYGLGDNNHALSWDNIPKNILVDAFSSYSVTESIWYQTFKDYLDNRFYEPTKEDMQKTKKHTLLLDKLYNRSYEDYLHRSIVKYLNSID
jgi:MoaA/NifB/PqqE/SkfB family radical SAM enzyme